MIAVLPSRSTEAVKQILQIALLNIPLQPNHNNRHSRQPQFGPRNAFPTAPARPHFDDFKSPISPRRCSRPRDNGRSAVSQLGKLDKDDDSTSHPPGIEGRYVVRQQGQPTDESSQRVEPSASTGKGRRCTDLSLGPEQSAIEAKLGRLGRRVAVGGIVTGRDCGCEFIAARIISIAETTIERAFKRQNHARRKRSQARPGL